MKLLAEHIFEENILQSLYFHTCVEFKLTHDLYTYVVESLGKFDNAGLVVKHIIDSLERSFEYKVIDCSNDNVWFKYVDVFIDNDHDGSASYEKYCNDIVYLTICCTSKEMFEKNLDEYVRLILHELLHGYEDYNRIRNTGKGICNYFDTKYAKSFVNIRSASKLKGMLSKCNYFLNDQERNAYLSQLESDIADLFEDEHITIEDFDYSIFKEKLKESNIWKVYFELSTFIHCILNENVSKSQKKTIEDVWKEMYDEDRSFLSIMKELQSKWNKFDNKFNQLVPKIVCKHIDTNLKEVAIAPSALDEISYWKHLL